MLQSKLRKQNGFSIVELLIIMVIIGVLIGVAIIQVNSASDNIKRQTIAKQIKVYLERARFDSVKRSPRNENEMSRVVIDSPTAYSYQTDINFDGNLQAGEIRQTTLNNNISIRDTGWNFPLVIKFDRNGHIIATDNLNNPITPNFEICEDNCSDPISTSSNANTISISPTGTVILLAGGETPSSYTTPAVTPIPPTDGVDPMVSTK